MCCLVNPMSSLSQESTRSRIQRRQSISSSEENYDLEASLASLRQIPEDHTLETSTGDLRESPSSPKRARAALANIFNRVKPSGSVSSSTGGRGDTIWTAKTSYAFDTRALFKRRITTLYNSLTSLRAYVELNYSGFRKIIKK